MIALGIAARVLTVAAVVLGTGAAVLLISSRRADRPDTDDSDEAGA